MKHAIKPALALMLLAGCAWAHHSFSQFDRSRTLHLSGTVRKLEWANPHVWLWVDVKNTDGSITPWGLEASAPGEMERNGGWSKHSLTKGEPITVDVSPLKDGRPGGSMGKITLADGTILGGRSDGGGPGGKPGGAGGPPPPPR